MGASIQASVHDRTQVEIDLDYHLKNLSGEWKIDLYLFVPGSFGINSSTYPREQFYNDLTNHIRLHTPDGGEDLKAHLEPLLSVLAGENKKSFADSYLIRSIKLFGNLANNRLKQIHRLAAQGDVDERVIERLVLSLEKLYSDIHHCLPTVVDQVRLDKL